MVRVVHFNLAFDLGGEPDFFTSIPEVHWGTLIPLGFSELTRFINHVPSSDTTILN